MVRVFQILSQEPRDVTARADDMAVQVSSSLRGTGT